MNQYFPKRYRAFVKIELDLSGYKTNIELKKATGIDTYNFALKSNLGSVNSEVDKIDVEKLKSVPVDLSKLWNIVNSDVVKKTASDKLVTKVNSIDTSEFALKTKYDTDKSDLEKIISDTEKKYLILVGLFKKQTLTHKLLK